MEILSAQKIDDELSNFEKGNSLQWGKVFLLLDSIDKSDYWKKDADSFTNWLENHADDFKVKSATLWRILSAGRFIQQERKRLAEKGVSLSTIEIISETVSPENIELLSKIQRAISDDKLASLATRVFSGDCKRTELRGIWQTYRPVLKGKTARGRGVAAPRLNQTDPEQQKALLEANTLSAFMAAGSDWTGIHAPELYHFFLHVNSDELKGALSSVHFSAVVAIKPQQDIFQLHGISFQSEISITYATLGSEQSFGYCEYFWILLNSNDQEAIKELITNKNFHPCIGVIEITGESLQVHKKAELISYVEKRRSDLLIALLIRLMGSKQ